MASVSMRIAFMSALRSGSSFSRATARRHTWHSMPQCRCHESIQPEVPPTHQLPSCDLIESNVPRRGNRHLRCIFLHQISRSQHVSSCLSFQPQKNVNPANEQCKVYVMSNVTSPTLRFWPCAALAHRLRRLKQPPQSFTVLLHICKT